MLKEAPAEASELRGAVRERAQRSLAFFAQAVLGRRMPTNRLVALQRGQEPATRLEKEAVEAWQRLQRGDLSTLPPLARFLLGEAVAS